MTMDLAKTPVPATFDGNAFVKNAPTKPGIYCMMDATDTIIYVGKARSLKHRLASYFHHHAELHAPKTRAMLAQICAIRVTVTHTETEALILENNIIKQYRPRYNVWFKDDKSYPYIHLNTGHAYPRLSYHRGSKKTGRYFGPYPNTSAVKKTIKLIQKLFLLRSCDEHFFRNRTRPCLQYQIKRCTAPCTGLIDENSYQEAVQNAMLFLQGKNKALISALTKPMQAAADKLDYERAAQYRNQINNLRTIQAHQYVSANSLQNVDILALAQQNNVICINLFMIRNGLHIGHQSFFPIHPTGTDLEDVSDAFLSQYYLQQQRPQDLPSEILLSHPPIDTAMLVSALSTHAGHQILIKHQLRTHRKKWMEMAYENVCISLQQRLSNKQGLHDKLSELQKFLNLDHAIKRIECFDVSHTQGEATVASCVVFGEHGPIRSDYRLFNIHGITAGDDFAATQQAIHRRYTRLQKADAILPDLLLIDGGKGQVSKAMEIMAELQISDIPLLGVAKGPARKAGQEKLIMATKKHALKLPADSPVLHIIQQIRDEAHRFAITKHKQGRKKRMLRSALDDIEGIGRKRRHDLLHYFGGLTGIVNAGVEDLTQVAGISSRLAKKIYDNFH